MRMGYLWLEFIEFTGCGSVISMYYHLRVRIIRLDLFALGYVLGTGGNWD